jgi:hypothetical protein
MARSGAVRTKMAMWVDETPAHHCLRFVARWPTDTRQLQPHAARTNGCVLFFLGQNDGRGSMNCWDRLGPPLFQAQCEFKIR